ncbi:hypothetical protein DPMN_131103 [Dreissena polymorpha]|uniref:Uncharacterized protein n=1 Tax=Dreissena polymorpha TaxID=45954 RepID=A0A9D4JY64_DREPO|nr:hypothetical protein DPMN_131103 [Dreissena polymorpha]
MRHLTSVIISSLIIQNAAEIVEAVHLLQRIALDCDGCVVGCVYLEHLALPSVDGEAQSTGVVCLFLHLLMGVGEKSQIIGLPTVPKVSTEFHSPCLRPAETGKVRVSSLDLLRFSLPMRP